MEEEQTGARSPLITFSHFLPYQVLTGLHLCTTIHVCHIRAGAGSEGLA